MKRKTLVILLLFAFIMAVPAVAYTASKTITVNTDMQIKVNGEVFKPKNVKGEDVMVFEYEGTTYAPLRALADAYGLKVGYDGASRMATVDKNEESAAHKIYITRTGSKYHYDSSCNGGTYWEVPLETAQGFGLKPCEKCVH